MWKIYKLYWKEHEYVLRVCFIDKDRKKNIVCGLLRFIQTVLRTGLLKMVKNQLANSQKKSETKSSENCTLKRLPISCFGHFFAEWN